MSASSRVRHSLWSCLFGRRSEKPAPRARRVKVEVESLEDRQVPAGCYIAVQNVYYGVSNVWTYPNAQDLHNELNAQRNGSWQIHGWAAIGYDDSGCWRSPGPGGGGGTGGVEDPGGPVEGSGQGSYIVNYSLSGVRRMLLRMAASLSARDFYSGWGSQKADWVRAVREAKSARVLATQLRVLERYIRWEAVTSEWRELRPGWLGQVRQATTPHQVGELALQLRDYLAPR